MRFWNYKEYFCIGGASMSYTYHILLLTLYNKVEYSSYCYSIINNILFDLLYRINMRFNLFSYSVNSLTTHKSTKTINHSNKVIS